MRQTVLLLLKPLLGAFLLAIISTLLVFNIYSQTEQTNKSILLAQAKNIAANFSTTRLGELNLSNLHLQLSEARLTIPKCKSIYILEEKEGKAVFVIDSSTLNEAKSGAV